MTSYRPISLLPIPSKVLEILLLKRLLSEIEHSQIIPPHQFGFREAHGTTEQVQIITEFIEIYRNLPTLWDIGSDLYKDRDKKSQAWQLLVDKLKEYG